MQVKCPNCGRELEWSESPDRPFCSERCRLIDMGAWLTERNAIPGEPAVSSPDSLPGSEHEP